MTVSNVSSTTSPYYQTIDPSGFQQRRQDFNSLASALQSGDLSSAQSALAAFQKDLPSTSQANASQPFGQNSQANTDFQRLQSALQSGDLSGAQKAFASLKTDFQPAQGAHGHHHHRRAGNAAGSNAGGSSSSSSSSASTSSSALASIIESAGTGLNVQA
jgi:hypothetical protein